MGAFLTNFETDSYFPASIADIEHSNIHDCWQKKNEEKYCMCAVEKIENIIAAAEQESNGGGGCLWDDPSFRNRLATISAKLDALETTNLRMLAREAAGQQVGPEASLLKINGTEIEQNLNELFMEALGNYAQPYEMDSLRIDVNSGIVGPDHGRGVMTEHLLRRASSIYGGTNEVQRDIIAKRVLGL